MPALYVSIWSSVALFALAEIGRARGGVSARWPRAVSCAGLSLALVHTALAFGIVHDWSHADAVRNTAAQTEAVFGVAVGSGVFTNYVFYAVWAADLALWRRRRSAVVSWSLRAFYFVIILNAAVIFAAGWRRAIGLAIVTVLVFAWSRPPRRVPQSFGDTTTIAR